MAQVATSEAHLKDRMDLGFKHAEIRIGDLRADIKSLEAKLVHQKKNGTGGPLEPVPKKGR